ncbi:hypothetical protein D3C87_1770270 [compost metagenome]
MAICASARRLRLGESVSRAMWRFHHSTAEAYWPLASKSQAIRAATRAWAGLSLAKAGSRRWRRSHSLQARSSFLAPTEWSTSRRISSGLSPSRAARAV